MTKNSCLWINIIPPVRLISRKSQKLVLLSLSWGGQSVLAEFEKSARMLGNKKIRDYCTIKYYLWFSIFINFFLFRMIRNWEIWNEDCRRNRRKSSRNFNSIGQWVIIRCVRENYLKGCFSSSFLGFFFRVCSGSEFDLCPRLNY